MLVARIPNVRLRASNASPLASEWRLAALLHDAPEYVVGDLISPFKAAIGLDYRAFEERLLAAIHVRFRLPHPLPKDVQILIKTADRIAAFHEATSLAGFAPDEANHFFGPVDRLSEPLSITITQLEAKSVELAQRAFRAYFESLSKS